MWNFQTLCPRVSWEGVAVGQERAAAPVRVPAWAAQNVIVLGKLLFPNIKVVIVKLDHKRKLIRKMKFLPLNR